MFLIPLFIDVLLESQDCDAMFDDVHVSRIGNWYLAITVNDDALNDCLKPGYIKREAVLKYLRDLKSEYLNTDNYLEALLRKQ